MAYFVCSLCTTCFVQKNVLSKQPCLICSHEFFHVAVPHILLLSSIPASCNEVLHREGFAENDLGIPDKQVGVKAGAQGISMDHQHEKLKWQDQKRWSQISLQPDVQEHINDHLWDCDTGILLMEHYLCYLASRVQWLVCPTITASSMVYPLLVVQFL